MPDHMRTRQRYASSDLGESLGLASEQARHAPEYLLNRYTVLGSRGNGGFGTVLECWDTRLQRRVAIKRMPLAVAGGGGVGGAAIAADGAVGHGAMGHGAVAGGGTVAGANLSTIEEALGEARTASRLEHPGIVTVHDFEVDHGIAYLVMEYVDGMTLTELLGRVEGGNLTHDECAYLAQQLGEAIGFAHEHGVLHLDIKPSNIMFTRDGKVKLCDFGMATLASAAGYADARGGTVGYMPPEQIEGELVDERSDIFALAVVLYQALFGIDPFIAPTADKSLALIARGVKPKPSKADPYLAGITEETLLACLSPDPGTRPADAAQVGNDLAFGLGDPDEGAASIADLTGQAAGEAEDEEDWEGEGLPFSVRYPWMYPLVVRVVTGVAAGAWVYALAPYALHNTQVPALAAALVAGAAGVAWTPLGSIVAMLAWAMALLSGGTADAAAVMTCGIALGLFAWWWVRTHKEKPAALALLAAPALGQPAAAAALAGGTLKPVAATATSVFAWALARMGAALAAQGYAYGQVTAALVQAFAPTTLLGLVGVAMGALAAAAITRSGTSVARGAVGQLAGCSLTVAGQMCAARLENGGIWPAPAWSTVGVAVTLGSFVCVMLALAGPRDLDGEDED